MILPLGDTRHWLGTVCSLQLGAGVVCYQRPVHSVGAQESPRTKSYVSCDVSCPVLDKLCWTLYGHVVHLERPTWVPIPALQTATWGLRPGSWAVIPGKKGDTVDQLFSVLGCKTIVFVSHESCSEDLKISKMQCFASLAWLLFLGGTIMISTK